jgi:hypothetical protein
MLAINADDSAVSHNAVIRIYDEAGNGIETHEHVQGVVSAINWACFAPELRGKEEDMLSFYPVPLLEKSRNRRNRLSSNCS